MNRKMDEITLIYTTFASMQDARNVASKLLNAKLIACANIMHAQKSLYMWQDKLQEDQEYIALLKTKKGSVYDAINKLKALHNYETPCILTFDAKCTNQAFYNWIEKSCLP